MNIKEEMKLHKWAQDMAEQQSSSLSQKKWYEMKGIPTTTFQYRCRKANLNHGEAIELDIMKENLRLRRELEEMKKENLFLKKAAAFFAKELD